MAIHARQPSSRLPHCCSTCKVVYPGQRLDMSDGVTVLISTLRLNKTAIRTDCSCSLRVSSRQVSPLPGFIVAVHVLPGFSFAILQLLLQGPAVRNRHSAADMQCHGMALQSTVALIHITSRRLFWEFWTVVHVHTFTHKEVHDAIRSATSFHQARGVVQLPASAQF